jgi:hypothetical protein
MTSALNGSWPVMISMSANDAEMCPDEYEWDFMRMNISAISEVPRFVLFFRDFYLGKWSRYFTVWIWPWITRSCRNVRPFTTNMMETDGCLASISPAAWRRANMRSWCFRHQIISLNVSRRVKDFPGDPPEECRLGYISRSVRGIFTWDREWELLWPLSAPPSISWQKLVWFSRTDWSAVGAAMTCPVSTMHRFFVFFWYVHNHRASSRIIEHHETSDLSGEPGRNWPKFSAILIEKVEFDRCNDLWFRPYFLNFWLDPGSSLGFRLQWMIPRECTNRIARAIPTNIRVIRFVPLKRHLVGERWLASDPFPANSVIITEFLSDVSGISPRNWRMSGCFNVLRILVSHWMIPAQLGCHDVFTAIKFDFISL